jgi:hypothetical protein
MRFLFIISRTGRSITLESDCHNIVLPFLYSLFSRSSRKPCSSSGVQGCSDDGALSSSCNLRFIARYCARMDSGVNCWPNSLFICSQASKYTRLGVIGLHSSRDIFVEPVTSSQSRFDCKRNQITEMKLSCEPYYKQKRN